LTGNIIGKIYRWKPRKEADILSVTIQETNPKRLQIVIFSWFRVDPSTGIMRVIPSLPQMGRQPKGEAPWTPGIFS
jgi:hypothetical protein